MISRAGVLKVLSQSGRLAAKGEARFLTTKYPETDCVIFVGRKLDLASTKKGLKL